jgi:DNA-directed RNA polymerase subunit RPC12/RpoP
MCRYAMTYYKPHYACFDCRKTFKRRLLKDVARDEETSVAAKCPECGSLMASMGLDFKSPRKDDLKAWQHMRSLYSVGITYHSCGCSGPGYIPATANAIVIYLEKRLADYVRQLRFWLNHIQPDTKAAFDRDKDKNWQHISRLPQGLMDKSHRVNLESAIDYWRHHVNNLEHIIGKAKAQVSIQ